MLGIILQATALAKIGGAIGAGAVAIGAAIGFGTTVKSTMEASARQPESAGNYRSTAIILGALLEGVCLFAVIVCLLAVVLS